MPPSLTREGVLGFRKIIANVKVPLVALVILRIKLRETKQIVVALVTTTFNALLAVAKANGGLSGRELYADNIYYLF